MKQIIFSFILYVLHIKLYKITDEELALLASKEMLQLPKCLPGKYKDPNSIHSAQ